MARRGNLRNVTEIISSIERGNNTCCRRQITGRWFGGGRSIQSTSVLSSHHQCRHRWGGRKYCTTQQRLWRWWERWGSTMVMVEKLTKEVEIEETPINGCITLTFCREDRQVRTTMVYGDGCILLLHSFCRQWPQYCTFFCESFARTALVFF